ncbi:MAG TPA: hypothetical protein PLO69_04200 [Gammaproteobacteria bacterium]|nr:hypothetical protein [Gammaproteobacteria bacterium]
MALNIETFSNVRGGNCVFKALGHPLARAPAGALRTRLASGPLCVYDPLGHLAAYAEFYDLAGVELHDVYVQRMEDLARPVLGHPVRPVTDLASASPGSRLLVAAFDAERYVRQIRHLLAPETEIMSFDGLRIPDRMLTNPRHYLDPLNFATNFAFLRDAGGHHTRVTLCDYWSGYGATSPQLWLCLFDADGATLAEWDERPGAPGATLRIDSREVRRRFGLGDYAGSLFIHAHGIAGHDVVKYALDTYGDDETVLSCTHDANAWPAERYAGLPAPDHGESVVLWIQNSHPIPIPAGAIGLSEMGSTEIRSLDHAIAPFATCTLDVARLLPESRWPAQIEVHAGKYFVRPRYEVRDHASGRVRLAHVNVERTDLQPDPTLASFSEHLGKGYLLPAPVLPVADWSTVVLPTPMSTAQYELPLVVILYDASGAEVLRRPLGRVPRGGCFPLDCDALLREGAVALPSGYGHVELVYDLHEGAAADGWLHALFRYRQRRSGHAAESSFGAHIYNLPVTYRNEPQSYAGPAPGLSTRLFLRIGAAPGDTLCHLIYPTSGAWHPHSSTRIVLHDSAGAEVAQREVAIPASGSLLWRYRALFDEHERERAGDGAYVVVRDVTCRLFGYHGLVHGERAFCLDHMFGF